MISTARPKRRTRASVFGDSPISSRNCAIRCFWLNPTSSTIDCDPRLAAALDEPPPGPRHRRRRRARRLHPRRQLAIEDREARFPGWRVVECRHQARAGGAEQIVERDRAVPQLLQRLAEEQARAEDRQVHLQPARRSVGADQDVGVVGAGREAAEVVPPRRVADVEQPHRRAEVDNERHDLGRHFTPADRHRKMLEPADVLANVGAQRRVRCRPHHLPLPLLRFVPNPSCAHLRKGNYRIDDARSVRLQADRDSAGSP